MFFGRKSKGVAILGLVGLCAGGAQAETPAVRVLTLEQTMELARERSPDVRLAREKTREAAGQTMVSRSRMRPNVSGVVSESRQYLSTAGLGLPSQTTMKLPSEIPFDIRVKGFTDEQLRRFGIPSSGATRIPDPNLVIPLEYPDHTEQFDLFTAQAKASVPLLNLQQRAEHKATLAEEHRVTMAVAQAEEDAMTQAALLYFNIMAAEEEVSASAEQVSTSEQKIELDEELLAAGKLKPLDVKRDRLALSSQRQDLREAQLKMAMAKRSLRQALDLPDDQDIAPADTLRFLPIRPEAPEAALEKAMTNRLDVILQRKSEEIAFMNRDAAKEAWWPTISASGTIGYQGHAIEESVDTWFIGVNANIPIWDSRQRRGALMMKTSMAEQTRQRTEQMTRSVDGEIRSAYDQLDAASNAVRVAVETVDVQRDTLALAQSKERAGTAKEMDVANAAADLSQARYKLVEKIFEYQQACIGWFRAIGQIQQLSPALAEARAAAEKTELTPAFPEGRAQP